MNRVRICIHKRYRYVPVNSVRLCNHIQYCYVLMNRSGSATTGNTVMFQRTVSGSASINGNVMFQWTVWDSASTNSTVMFQWTVWDSASTNSIVMFQWTVWDSASTNSTVMFQWTCDCTLYLTAHRGNVHDTFALCSGRQPVHPSSLHQFLNFQFIFHIFHPSARFFHISAASAMATTQSAACLDLPESRTPVGSWAVLWSQRWPL